MALWKMFGDEFPLIAIGSFDGSMYETGIMIQYKQAILLDFSHPQFFLDFDKLLNHLIDYDDLSQFVLST